MRVTKGATVLNGKNIVLYNAMLSGFQATRVRWSTDSRFKLGPNQVQYMYFLGETHTNVWPKEKR